MIEPLLYLRSIGAEPLVRFQQKPSPCKEHWQQHATEAGLDDVVAHAEELVPSLANEARISVHRESSNHTYSTFVHPAFENDYVHVDLDRHQLDGKSEQEIRRCVAEEVIRRFVAYLTTDVIAARKFKVPLGATIRFHGALLERSKGLSTAGVAFRIELPVLQGVSLPTLIKIRQDEHEYFKRFQLALRTAINERINTA
jgi:hypothetical protein